MLLIPMDGSSATWKLWSRNGNRGDHSPNQSPASTTRQEARQEACYRADVVRDFRLDTKPASFNKKLVLDGWGEPSKVGKDGDFEIFLYEDGLLVYFDKSGWNVLTMVFTVPQPTSAPDAGPAPPPPQR